MSDQPIRITVERPPPPRYIPGKCYALKNPADRKTHGEGLAGGRRGPVQPGSGYGPGRAAGGARLMAAMTAEQIAEARRLLDASTADIPGDASDEEVDRRVHERTVAERTFMAKMAPALLAEVERLREEAGQARLDEQYDAMATAGAFDEEDPF